MSESFMIKPIAKIYTDFPEKFGIPRQSGMVEELEGKIVFSPEYRFPEAVRELDGFSHIWLIWQFSGCASYPFRPTVRPPRLGGNKRVGVFASRSPFRPNSLGLSCVRLKRVDLDCDEAPVLYVSGIDLMNETPIFDIKPYLPFADSKTDATPGYTAFTERYSVKVRYNEQVLADFPKDKLNALISLLENDPRPSYKARQQAEYAVSFAGYNIRFRARDGEIEIIRTEKNTEKGSLQNGTSD